MTTVRERDKSLLACIPMISMSIEKPEDNDIEDDDVMTAEEEQAALKYLSKDGGGQIHRMSSLDVYLSEQKKEQPEPLLLNRKKSLRIEEEETALLNETFEALEISEKEKNIAELKKEIKNERERKRLEKEKNMAKFEAFDERRRSKIHLKQKKKKGLGGLSREKKKRLKEMILQKAHEEMLNERKAYESEKQEKLKLLIKPLHLDSLAENELYKKCEELYETVKQLEEQKYEWEQRILRQECEINELTNQINVLPGKFPMPILKRVSKHTSRLARLLRYQQRSTSLDPA